MTSEIPLIERLHGLRLPPPVVADAPNPWLVASVMVLACVLAAILIFILWRAFRLPAHRREARGLIGAARGLPHSSQLMIYAQVLRRVAMVEQAPREILVSTGANWLAWLDTHFSTDYFARGAGRVFGDALYQNTAPDDVSSIGAELQRLLKQRRRDAPAG